MSQAADNDMIPGIMMDGDLLRTVRDDDDDDDDDDNDEETQIENTNTIDTLVHLNLKRFAENVRNLNVGQGEELLVLVKMLPLMNGARIGPNSLSCKDFKIFEN